MALPKLDDFNNLTFNAREMARNVQDDTFSDTIIVSLALEIAHPKILALLQNNLNDAIEASGEYNFPAFKGTLQEVFSNPNLIQATPNGILNIIDQVLQIAGSESDLFDGINAARAELGVGMGDIEKRAAFWKHFIYRPAREGAAAPQSVPKGKKQAARNEAKQLYEKTIQARLSAWGNKVPFWIWLEFGNMGPVGAGHEYPPVGASRFVLNTEEEGQILFDEALDQVRSETENILAQELDAFAQADGTIRKEKPGTILQEFFVKGEPFVIYVTLKRRDVGVARLSSYKRILRRG